MLLDFLSEGGVGDRHRMTVDCHDLSTPSGAIVMLTGDMADSHARVAHVGIAVPSIAAAVAFYRDVFGLEPGRAETAGGATIVGLAFGDGQTGVPVPARPPRPLPAV